MKKWILIPVFFLLLTGCSNMIDSFSNKDDSKDPSGSSGSLSIQGDPYRGSNLSATYSASGPVTLQWCQYDPATTTTTTVAGENSATYTVRTADLEKEVFLQISDGSSTYDSNSIAIVDRLPFAENVTIDGIPSASNLLTGTYNYSDPEGDPEAISTYRWLISDTLNGTYAEISGETDLEYDVAIADACKFIKLEVTPVSNNGIGNPVISSAVEINNLNPLSFELVTSSIVQIQYPGCIKCEDIDYDGDRDVIINNSAANGLYILENTGNLTFNSHTLNTSNSQFIFKIQDIDNNGYLDILSAEFNSTDKGMIHTYANQGNFNFTENYEYVSNNLTFFFEYGDFNNNGTFEYLISDKTIFLYNPGAGSINQFEKKDISISNVNHRINLIEYGNFNGDSRKDIITFSHENDSIYTQMSENTSDYTEYQINCNIDGPTDIFVIDFDNDGLDDILISSFNDDSIYLFINNGDNTFTQNTVSNNCVGASSVSALDFDLDGDIDIFSTSMVGDRVYMYSNEGSLNFTASTISNDTDGPIFHSLCDIDHDGDYDLVVASTLDGIISLYFNNSGSFGTRNIVAFNLKQISSLEISDIDGDGEIDIIASSEHFGSIFWYKNDGNEHFSYNQISNKCDDIFNATVFDADFDGDPDITYGSTSNSKTGWFENDGNGFFTEVIITNNKAGILRITDLDGDNLSDFISPGYDSNKIIIYSTNLSYNPLLKTAIDNTPSSNSLYSYDIDDDGDQDFCAFIWDINYSLNSYINGGYFVFYENTNNSFSKNILSYGTQVFSPYYISFFDYNGDGFIDIVPSSQYINPNPSMPIYLFKNDGSLNFSPTVEFPIINDLIATGTYFYIDIDLDGDKDIFSFEIYGDYSSTSIPYNSYFIIRENDGNNNYTRNVIFSSDSTKLNTFVYDCSDIDSDGDIDILFAYDSEFAILKNKMID